MNKKKTNDQGHILEALERGKPSDLKYVWKQVKYIGVAQEANMNTRYLIYMKAARIFNRDKDKNWTNENNNFIQFYKNYLTYYKPNMSYSSLFTTKYQTQIKLNNEKISPSEENSKRIKGLSKWDI